MQAKDCQKVSHKGLRSGHGGATVTGRGARGVWAAEPLPPTHLNTHRGPGCCSALGMGPLRGSETLVVTSVARTWRSSAVKLGRRAATAVRGGRNFYETPGSLPRFRKPVGRCPCFFWKTSQKLPPKVLNEGGGGGGGPRPHFPWGGGGGSAQNRVFSCFFLHKVDKQS